MPYVDQESRDKYFHLTTEIDKLDEISSKGDLEFIVFYLMKKFMKTRQVRYATLHEVVYAVIHAGEEYKRRFLDKREDEALFNNGDI